MIPILDHGYIKLVRVWGSEEEIIEAARMSTGKGFNGWGGDPCPECTTSGRLYSDGTFIDYMVQVAARSCSCKGTGKTTGDEGLLRRLYTDKHMTPFEMAGMVIEVQAPIFVFREWHRHRTQSYNEMSARYTPLPDVNYMPTVDRLMVNAYGSNKQANRVPGAPELIVEDAEEFISLLQRKYDDAEELYQYALKRGVPKELARLIIPVGRYSRMRASTNLRNWLGFLTLRMDKDAQWEIRQYANAVGDLIAEHFPYTWRLFNITGPVITPLTPSQQPG